MTEDADDGARVVLVRHGETEWSRQRRHTGRTDIPLDDNGRRRAAWLRPALAGLPGIETAAVFTSPLRRARETAELAGCADRAVVCDDLLEWDYGDFEGRRTSDIREEIPGWSIWTDPVTGGESVEQVGARADRMIAIAVGHGGLSVMFAHAHILRILGVRWCGLPPGDGRIVTLEPASISILSHEREVRVVDRWNAVPEICSPGPTDQPLPS